MLNSSPTPIRGALAAATLFLALVSSARAADPVATTYDYTIDGAAYEGTLARPLVKMESYPAVLVVHDWMGNNEFSRSKAEYLARLGYIAFAVDMYGKGNRATNGDEASKLAARLYQDPKLFRERMLAALAELKKQPGVDPSRLGAIGFCFGGTSVLELARSGADISAVVSFHGGLKPFGVTAPDAVKARLLILYGNRDPLVKPDDLAACMNDLNQAHAHFDLIGYADAVHAFTNPMAGNDPSKGIAYNARADKESFAAMERFFREAFGK